MTQSRSRDWITAFLAQDPPRSKSLVMTLFGDAIAPHGGAIWLGSLIELAAPFGINDRLLRTSVYRLAQEGWLTATRDGRRSAYAILPDALPRFERAYRRIYAPLELHWDGTWTLVLSASGSVDAPSRATLRKELLWAGYALIPPGAYAHPAADTTVLDEILLRTGAAGKVFSCSATDLGQASARPLRALVDDSWDLSGVAHGYESFVATFAPLLDMLRSEPAAGPELAYMIRTLAIHAYRRVQLHDPQLPLELLPASWPAPTAYALAAELYRATYAAAEEHIVASMRREDAGTPAADALFFGRFGGLL
jgi:phenylacetic acid degradation operon negative regulatory protein